MAGDGENKDALVLSDDPEHPANLIPALCAKFWTLGWVTGTGGGCSIRQESVFRPLLPCLPALPCAASALLFLLPVSRPA